MRAVDGEVVGWEEGDAVGEFSGLGYGTGHAFAFRDGKTTDLGTLPGRPYGWANSVNNRGQIVGSTYAIDDRQYGEEVGTRAVLWQDRKITDLGTLPGGTRSDAVAINERGQIIGTSYDERHTLHGIVWQSGRTIDLGPKITPVAINDRGQVIANRNVCGRAFLWQNGKIAGLGSLGGQGTCAAAINEHGQIVGTSSDTPVLWQNRKLIRLPELPGHLGGAAVAINEHNQIVGWCTTTTFKKHAVLWKLQPR